MDALIYLLQVADVSGLHDILKHKFGIGVAPEYVRLSTLAPLSNQGYPEGAEGQLMGWDADGLVVGVSSNSSIPRAFVPWQNVAYVADGTYAYNQALELAELAAR